YRHGVLATKAATAAHRTAQRAAQPAPFTFTGLQYFGGTNGVGVTTGSPKVYLVYWGSQWGTAGTNGNGDTTLSGDTAGVAPVQQEFFKGVGTNHEGWSRVPSQYCQGVAKGATSCPASAAHLAYPSGTVLA